MTIPLFIIVNKNEPEGCLLFIFMVILIPGFNSLYDPEVYNEESLFIETRGKYDIYFPAVFYLIFVRILFEMIGYVGTDNFLHLMKFYSFLK